MRFQILLFVCMTAAVLQGEEGTVETASTQPQAIERPAIQEVVLSNKEPLNVAVANKEPLSVTVANFPAVGVQAVSLENDDPIRVRLIEPVEIVQKERGELSFLNDATNLLTVETSATLGKLGTDLQTIYLYKVNLKNDLGEKTGVKLHFIAEDKLEISKDFKILVENEIYMDENKVEKLQKALSKILSLASGTVENKDFKLSFKTPDDFELTLYTTKKMFGNGRDVTATMVIGKEQKYSSKSVLNLKELTEFKTMLDLYKTTKINPI
ncbi:MAG: hypothetical protein M0P91_01750 [Sulfuricurvum sp.]|jgi:hypothetical protein|uniref:hypothetical protein n=1 Tax=Sulfuricurvum sp. TaxID=2025608 RepID=UPI0025ED827E|nr:hypothetical protein [Sulfuricurvum sp.]MCK9371894.1 hypothetical protein [Sulfuricurvum sp.]